MVNLSLERAEENPALTRPQFALPEDQRARL